MRILFYEGAWLSQSPIAKALKRSFDRISLHVLDPPPAAEIEAHACRESGGGHQVCLGLTFQQWTHKHDDDNGNKWLHSQ